MEIVTLSPESGSSQVLDASASIDPDGDKLGFSWWVMSEVGTYTKDIAISDSKSTSVTINIPKDCSGKSFHIICAVTDNGTPRLTSYRRIIVELK